MSRLALAQSLIAMYEGATKGIVAKSAMVVATSGLTVAVLFTGSRSSFWFRQGELATTLESSAIARPLVDWAATRW